MIYSDADTQLVAILDRAGRASSSAERRIALNHGYREMVRTITDVRGNFFIFETGDFTVPANQIRVPLTGDVWEGRKVKRIRKIVSLGTDSPGITGGVSGYGAGPYGGGAYGGGTTTNNTASPSPRKWTYREIASGDFRRAELLPPQDCQEIFFDLIMPLGIPTLALAPALSTDDTPFMSTIYGPDRLVLADDVIEPVIEEHIETLLAYAMEWLLMTTNDADADRWGVTAREGKQRIIQHVSPKVEGETNQLGSALWDMGGDAVLFALALGGLGRLVI